MKIAVLEVQNRRLIPRPTGTRQCHFRFQFSVGSRSRYGPDGFGEQSWLGSLDVLLFGNIRLWNLSDRRSGFLTHSGFREGAKPDDFFRLKGVL